jgi:hypothetical protein
VPNVRTNNQLCNHLACFPLCSLDVVLNGSFSSILQTYALVLSITTQATPSLALGFGHKRSARQDEGMLAVGLSDKVPHQQVCSSASCNAIPSIQHGFRAFQNSAMTKREGRAWAASAYI